MGKLEDESKQLIVTETSVQFDFHLLTFVINACYNVSMPPGFFDSLLQIFLIFALGVLARKKNIISDQGVSQLSSLLINVVVPCLGFSFITRELLKNPLTRFLPVMFLGVCVCLTGFMVSLIISGLLRLPSGRASVFVALCTIGNTIFLPLPIAQNAYGERGVVLVLFADLGASFILWTLGVWLYSGRTRTSLRNLINPPFVSILLAIGFYLTGLSHFVPVVILNALSLAGSITAPLGLLLTGAILSTLSFQKNVPDMSLLTLSFIKLMVVPFVLLGILKLFIFQGARVHSPVFSVILLQAAMPTMASAPVFARLYGTDEKYAAAGTLLTHLFCIATMPFVFYYANF